MDQVARATGFAALELAGASPGPSSSSSTPNVASAVFFSAGCRLTYSLLDATLDLADGATLSSSYDVTHTLAVVGQLALGESWELGLTGRYATGRPYTPIVGRTAPPPDRPLAPAYGQLLSARYPDYRRLDARLTRFVDLPGRSIVLYLEGLNVLDRRNVVGYTYDAEYRSPEPVRAFFSKRTLVLGGELVF